MFHVFFQPKYVNLHTLHNAAIVSGLLFLKSGSNTPIHVLLQSKPFNIAFITAIKCKPHASLTVTLNQYQSSQTHTHTHATVLAVTLWVDDMFYWWEQAELKRDETTHIWSPCSSITQDRAYICLHVHTHTHTARTEWGLWL